MSEGWDLQNRIIDAVASYYSENGRPPRVLRLPVKLAYNLAKAEHSRISDKIMQEGLTVLEREGLMGLQIIFITDDIDEFFLE